MSRLSQQSLALEQQAKVPSAPSLLALGLIDDDSVQQALAANLLDPSSVGADRTEALESLTHALAEVLGASGEVLVDDNLEGGGGDGAGEGVLGGKSGLKGEGGAGRGKPR